MRRMLISVILLIVGCCLAAETIQYHFNFDQPNIEIKDGKSVVTVPQLANTGNPGDPFLPAYPVKILLPQAEMVRDFSIDGTAQIIALHAPVYPVQQQYPLSKLASMTPAFTNMRNDISTMPVFPEEMGGNEVTGVYRGYTVYTMLLYPVRYLPQENALEFYSELDLTIETTFDAEAQKNAPYVRKDSHTLDAFSRMVINPENAFTYTEQAQDRDRVAYDYLIITIGSLLDTFAPLVEYKNSLGIRTTIVDVDDVLAAMQGDDDQEKIRNYINAEYLDCGIEYVLLAGDDEDIPHRGFLVDPGYYEDDDIPSDMYFFCLDGDWNSDGDNNWGEWNEIDFYAEVYGGRACVDNIQEAENFVNKQLMYQTQPVVDDLTNNALVGEDLGWACWGMDFLEEVHYGSSNYGYTTVGIPEHIDVTGLYDMQGTWSTTQLFNLMNSGMNLIGHLGHCSTHYNMKFETDDVTLTRMTNNGTNHNFYIIYTQGCYCNAFDNRDTNGYHSDEDAISEQWNNLQNGAACYVGNTRYGWGDSQQTNGASQHLQREFYDALYGENITVISKAQADSKDDTVPYLSANTVMLWSYFESTLLGDPTLDIWSDQPAEVTIDTPEIIPLGSSSFEATVTVSDNNVEEILLAAFFNDELIARYIVQNGVSEQIELMTIPDIPGAITISVSGHNILNATSEIDVIAPDEAFIVPGEIAFLDNNNNFLGWNEAVEVSIPASNVGNQGLDNLTAVLTTDCEYIRLGEDEVEFGAVAAHETVTSEMSFTLATVVDIPAETQAEFTVTFTSGTSEWQYNFSVPIQVPIFGIQNEVFEELSGNGNGIPDPGDLIRIDTDLINEGDFILDSLSVTLCTDHSDVTITPDVLSFSDIDPGSSVGLGNFNITLGTDIVAPTNIVFYMNMRCERGYRIGRILNLTIDPFQDNFETTYYDWEHYTQATGTNDQWHRSTEDNYTVGGEYSWKCGSSGTGGYNDDLYTALEGPQFSVPEDAWLTFWHRMGAEDSNNYPGYAYDGGFVQISTDGGDSWDQIEPEGGYPFLSRGDSSHLPSETPLFSGDITWTQVYFDLADFAGDEAIVRFVFASDGNTSGEGWYVDNVRIETEMPLLPPTDIQGSFAEGIAQIDWVSPDVVVESFTIKRDGEIIAENVTSNHLTDDLTEMTETQFVYSIACVRGEEISEYCDYTLYISSNGNGNAPEVANQLWQNYPNPFNPETKIRYSVSPASAAQNVTLKIYNIRGQLVRTLVNEKLDSGMHEAVWKGINESGNTVGSGVYFYRLEIGDDHFNRKMLLLK